MTETGDSSFASRHPITTAIALAFGAAIALGMARFAYGLFLPFMVEDLSWSYTVAGSMNMANALGYFIGALCTAYLFRKYRAAHALLVSAVVVSLLMGLSALLTNTSGLFIVRTLTGVASAPVFIGGAVLVARLGNLHASRSGLLIGIYYGGCGLGIILSSVLVPASVEWAQQHNIDHSWQPGWWWLAIAGLVLTVLMIIPSLAIPAGNSEQSQRSDSGVRQYLPLVIGYGLFGMGYIGYMTFVIALLKNTGLQPETVNLFYLILGLAVMISARLWAAALDNYRGGKTLAILNSLIGIACLLPACVALLFNAGDIGNIALAIIFFSGILFGCCFLSAVAATTAFVKHNLPQEQWIAGITVFTCVFGGGQVLGPLIVGWIADQSNGLARGLVVSGMVLLAGGLIAAFQKPLKIEPS